MAGAGPRAVALRRPRITPDLATGSFLVELPLSANVAGHRVRATLSDADGMVVTAEGRADLDLCPRLVLTVPESRLRTWSPADPHLYDLALELLGPDGEVVDTAGSYAGLRSVSVRGKELLLNGERVFQRLVLDQGYYPDGLMTAPTDAALLRDIELGIAAGFNGARLHQKVFEERYLYHADRLGYLVWGEFGDWGCETGVRDDNQRPDASFITQWLEALERDHSHPSIVGWCPLNETYQNLHDRITVLDDVTRGMFLATKQADPTRPVVDASGYAHRVPETDVYDSHCYEQDPVAFAKIMAGLAEDRPYVNTGPEGRTWSVPYRGQPYFCSEFGGIWWDPETVAAAGDDTSDSWGYGERPRTEGGVRGAVPRSDRRAARRPRDVRLLLHAAHRRLPGTQRRLPLRPLREGRHRAVARGPAAPRGVRGDDTAPESPLRVSGRTARCSRFTSM